MSRTDEIHREYTLACTHAAGYTRRMHERAYFSSLACPPGEILDRRAIGDINDFREQVIARVRKFRSEEHTSELQSLMRISYAVFCLKKKKTELHTTTQTLQIYQ